MRLSILAVAVLSSVLWMGCGDGGNPEGGGGGTLGCGYRECRSAEMPDGKIWMTENLNKTTKDSWCYDNSPANCAKYGRLYTWNDAKTVCPAGWKLPDTADWNKLIIAAGWFSSKLKSKSGWYNNGNGTDDFQFSALPGGYKRWHYDATFEDAGYRGLWWTASVGAGGNSYARGMDYDYDYVHDMLVDWPINLSVRCVK